MGRTISFAQKNRGAVSVFQASVGPMFETAKSPDTKLETLQDTKPAKPALPPSLPKEIGGPKGPEPTRYGDWERNGRVSDF
jgi:hypothetical protein